VKTCEKCGAVISPEFDECLVCLANEAEQRNVVEKEKADKKTKKTKKKSKTKKTKEERKKAKQEKRTNSPETVERSGGVLTFVLVLIILLLIGAIAAYIIFVYHTEDANEPTNDEQTEEVINEEEVPEIDEITIINTISSAFELIYQLDTEARIEVNVTADNAMTLSIYVKELITTIDYETLNEQLKLELEQAGFNISNINTSQDETIELGSAIEIIINR